MTLFLLLHIIRPYNKRLRAITGLAWLPLLAFLCSVVLFPAYGFRPELIPLLIYAAVLAGISLSKKARYSTVYESIRKTRPGLAIPPLVILAVTAGIAFYYTPEKDTAPITCGVYTLKEKEYLIRIYTEVNESLMSPRPLMVLLPPVLGSQAAVDQVCGELRDRGFTVLSYSRRGFDYGIGPIQWIRRINASLSGTNSASANVNGQTLEKERGEDILFLMSWIIQNPALEERTRLFNIASRDEVFFAGYGAGGSALIQWSERAFPPAGLKILGLIAIESYLWSAYQTEIPEIPILPPDADWITSIKHGFKSWFAEMKPKKITGPGQVPGSFLPILFLVSDRGRDPFGRYQAMYRSFEAARGPAIIISSDGAGLLDYSDFTVKYPVLAALIHGRERSAWDKPGTPGETADLISGFAASVLNAGGGSRLRNAPLPLKIMITPNGAWPPAPSP